MARAYSEGRDLDLTLYPGGGGLRQTLTVARLQPGKAYRLEGAETSVVTADDQGQARFDVKIEGRTAVRLDPS